MDINFSGTLAAVIIENHYYYSVYYLNMVGSTPVTMNI
jgi:hypothetical protein